MTAQPSLRPPPWARLATSPAESHAPTVRRSPWPGVAYGISINGVTAVGENNRFTPAVGSDGTFKLKLPQGLFYPPYGTVTFPFEGKKYIADLDPVDPVQGTRDGAADIVQTKPVLVYEMDESKYKPTAKLILQPYANEATLWTRPTMLHWIVE